MKTLFHILLFSAILAAGARAAPGPEPEDKRQRRAELTEKAFQGDVESMLLLARFYKMNQDYRGAAQWFRKAGERGNASALLELAALARGGWDAPVDEELARRCYLRLLELGDNTAYRLLGEIYEDERGSLHDVTQAILYYQDGANNGDPAAMLALGKLFTRAAGGPPRHELARHWLERAAQLENPEAMRHFALQLLYGVGGPEDQNQAWVWYRRASDKGDGMASLFLGDALYEGRWLPQNKAVAKHYYELAVKQGVTAALIPLKERQF